MKLVVGESPFQDFGFNFMTISRKKISLIYQEMGEEVT